MAAEEARLQALDWQLMLTGQQVTLAQQVLQHMGILAGFAGMRADEAGKV